MNSRRLFPAIFLLALLCGSCRGGEFCGPLSESLEDMDGDCVANTSDNCPVDPNAGQIDADDDGLGNICDEDDSDETCGLITSTSNGTCAALVQSQNLKTLTGRDTGGVSAYPYPEDGAETVAPDFPAASCDYYLVGCDGRFLGFLNGPADADLSLANPDGEYGNTQSDVSIFNPLGMYGRSFTSCSAFNEEANYPPALFCRGEDGGHAFAGYMTLNPDAPAALDACRLATLAGRAPEACE